MANDPWAEFPLVEDDPWREFPLAPTWQERVGSGLRGAAQSVTFGGADELRGAVRGGIRALQGEPYGPAYAEERDRAREEERRLGAKAPGAYLAGQVGGALLTAPLMPAAPAATLPRMMAQGARAGALAGGAQGFGSGEGGFRQRLESAGQGAIAGGAVGAAAAPVMRLAGDTVNGLLGRAPRTEAERLLQGGLADEGVDAAKAIREANRAGVKDMTIADVSRRARDYARDVGAAPSPAQAQLREFHGRRQGGEFVPGQGTVGGQYRRVTGTLRDLSGVGGQKALQSMDDIIQARRSEAKALFGAAEKFDTSSSAKLATIWDNLKRQDAGKAIMPEVRKMWMDEFPGQRFPLTDPTKANAPPDMRSFQLIKEALDDHVSALYKAGKGGRAERVKAIRDNVRDTLKLENPAYETALDAYAGKTAMKEALEEGGKIVSASPEAVQRAMARYGTSEREMYRISAINKLVDGLSKPTGEMTDFVRALKDPNRHDKIMAILPDDTSRVQFDRILLGEEGQSLTAATHGGSQTQARLEVAADVGRGRALLDFLLSLPHSLGSAMLRAGTAVSERARGVDTAARRGELGKMLMRTDEDAAQLVERLMRVNQKLPSRSATPAGLVGGAVGPGMVPPGTAAQGFDLLTMLSDGQRRRLGLPSGGPTP